MTEDTKSREDAVRQAAQELREEHAQIMALVKTIEEGKDVAAISGQLETLHEVLLKHFAHEEYPKGLYDVMGACTAEHRDELRVLVDQHFSILSNLRGLVERSRGDAAPETVLTEARALAESLREHETLEHKLAAELSR